MTVEFGSENMYKSPFSLSDSIIHIHKCISLVTVTLLDTGYDAFDLFEYSTSLDTLYMGIFGIFAVI